MTEQPAPVWAPWAMRRALAAGAVLRQPMWGIGDAIRTLALALASTVLLYLVLALNHVDPGNGWGLIATSWMLWAVLGLWPLRVAARKGNGAVLDFGLRTSSRHVRLALVIFGIGMAAAAAAAWVITQVHGPFTSAAGQAAAKQHGAVLVVFAASTVVIAPVCEELAFRGLLFTALLKRGVADRLTVLLSAVAFAAFHFEATRFPLLLVLGLALGEVRRRTGSTAASMVTHALVNLLPAISMLTA